MRRLVLAFLAVSLTAGALSGGAAPSGSGTVQTLTWKLRWPTAGKTVRYTRSARQLNKTIRDVRILVNGVEVDEEPSTIVACAHRGPSFAGASFGVPKPYTMRFRITLQSGPCIGGPKTAGKLVKVKALVYYR